MFFLRRIHLEIPRCHGLEVHRHAGIGILRRPDGVDVGVLVEIEILLVPGDAEEHARELEHVVGVARLAVGVGALGVEHVVHAEVLPLRIAARDIGMVRRHALPEHFCDGEVLRRVHELAADGLSIRREIAVERADDLGDGGVGVLAVQVVVVAHQHVLEEVFLVEHMGGCGVLFLPRDGIQIVHAVVHAAVLDGEHGALRAARPAAHALIHPVAQFGDDGERPLAARKRIGVQQPRDDLVHGVPRHPRLRVDVRPALLHVVELQLHVGGVQHARPPQKALFGAVLGVVVALALFQFAHHIFKPLGKAGALLLRRARIGDRLRERREIVPHRMPADERALPAAAVARRAVAAQRGVGVEVGKQPVGVQKEQIADLLFQTVRRIAVRDDRLAQPREGDGRAVLHLRLLHGARRLRLVLRGRAAAQHPRCQRNTK